MSDRRLLVLNFHGIGDSPRALDPGEERVWLSRSALESALDAASGRPDVRITFDDGNASDLSIAVPALVRRGLTATFYVPAGLLGRPGYLDERGLREVAAAEMGVGSHGMMHRPWRGMAPDELRDEIAGSRSRLEGILGRTVDEAACPFGSYDRRSLRVLAESGYALVCTSDCGRAREGDWLQPRNTVYADHDGDDLRRLLDDEPGFSESLLRAVKGAVKRWR